MSDFNSEHIKIKSFSVNRDKCNEMGDYYNLRFGDSSSGTVITCHKSHLVELARKINTLGELYD